jgi:tripartite ATP-independent transporter DctP family solute receptor
MRVDRRAGLTNRKEETMKFAKLSAILSTTVLAFGMWPAAAGAQQPVTIRLGHVGFPGSLFDVTGNKFAQDVNNALKGRVEVRVFHSSQLGSDEAMIKGLRIGAPEMQIPSTIMSTVDQRYGVFEMPYLIINRVHMKKVQENKEVQKALLDPLPARGMRVLGVWENGYRHVTNNRRPIVFPGDMNDIKLRVPGGVWRVKMFKTYGANPSPMPFAEVYSALQSGVMDGQENPFSQIFSAKFHEVQKYLSLTGHVYTPAYLVVSEDFWKKLPKDVQATIAKIAWATGDFARSEGERMDKELQSKLAPPMIVNTPNKEAFIKASGEVYEDFGKQIPGGAQLIKTIQSLR